MAYIDKDCWWICASCGLVHMDGSPQLAICEQCGGQLRPEPDAEAAYIDNRRLISAYDD